MTATSYGTPTSLHPDANDREVTEIRTVRSSSYTSTERWSWHSDPMYSTTSSTPLTDTTDVSTSCCAVRSHAQVQNQASEPAVTSRASGTTNRAVRVLTPTTTGRTRNRPTIRAVVT